MLWLYQHNLVVWFSSTFFLPRKSCHELYQLPPLFLDTWAWSEGGGQQAETESWLVGRVPVKGCDNTSPTLLGVNDEAGLSVAMDQPHQVRWSKRNTGNLG